MEAIVEVRELKKNFGTFEAVKSVTFDLLRGEILGLVGPNGAGKSTTLQMLLGLTTPTSGNIKLFGLDHSKSREEILMRVNFSSSYISLPLSLTVEENLNVFANLYGVRERREKVGDVMELFEITDLRGTAARRLSSGQLTRVCLAKALLNDPEVLFLDEPTASLDPDIADKTRTLLARIKAERGISILYTSHNMKEMEELCDRIIFLDRGRILATGRPEEVVERYGGGTLEEVFLRISRSEEVSGGERDGGEEERR